jgi:hypothetical protein
VTDTKLTNRDLKGLRDSKGKPLKAEQLYYVGRGTKQSRVTRVRSNGTVDLQPAEIRADSRNRSAVKPARLTRADHYRKPALPSRLTKAQRAQVQINSMAALANLPHLEGAACVGHARLFDHGAPGKNYRQAAAICASCPALEACRTWAATVPAKKLTGLIAGKLYGPPSYE